jgi:NAD(P)H-dependent FMN reductase
MKRCAMTRYKVGYLVGSLATASINRRLAKALIRHAPESLEFSEISFKDLPIYSYDYDHDYPPVARAFRMPSQRPTRYCSSPRNTTAPFREG